MKNHKTQNIRLGLLVLLGTVLLITALYTIGSKQNLFGSKIRIIAEFKDVNGLMTGNNVNFSGINIGTVESVRIATDSSIRVVMVIQKNAKDFIKKNALASIGTDGLMGNKLVNINVINQPADKIEDMDILEAVEPIATEQMMQVLRQTNEDVARVVYNLREISDKLNSPNNLWNILVDTVVSDNIRETIEDLRRTGHQASATTDEMSMLVKGIGEGKGTLGNLVTESTLSDTLEQAIINIHAITDSLAYITGDLKVIFNSIKKGEGAIGTLLTDTVFVQDLTKSMENIRRGSDGFNENMDALKHSIFLRRYFRRQAKEKTESKD